MIGRNELCSCGSKLKFKKCCLRTVEKLLPHGVKWNKFRLYQGLEKMALAAARAAKEPGYNGPK